MAAPKTNAVPAEISQLVAAISAMGKDSNKKDSNKKESKWDKLDVPIEHAGRAITLPADPDNMPPEKAIEALQRRISDDNQLFDVVEPFDAYPHDAAVAFVKAMCKLYGWASPQTYHATGMFGQKIEVLPDMLSVKTGLADDDVVQCPLGEFKLPGLEESIRTVIANFPGRFDPQKFLVAGKLKKRDRHVIVELVAEAKRILRDESIYRGKPIRLGVDDGGDLMEQSPPTFMDVSDMDEACVLFDDDVTAAIDTNILVPIRETALCRQHKIPLKRGILLEGPYGCGKSLTAKLAARMAELHGWTFVLLDKVQGLKAALEFAKRYAPAVVFAEDIDRIAAIRDDEANDLINTIDGVVSKGTEIMTVLTTNFVDKLDPVILRPGRLDAVISVRAPNAETVQRLIRHYAGKLLPLKEDLVDAGQELAGQIPASIRECVERAKLGMIGRKATTLAQCDIVTAAKTMKNHLALLNKKKNEPSKGDALADALQAVVHNGTGTLIREMHENMGLS